MNKKDKKNYIIDIIQHPQLINHIGNIKYDYCLGCTKINNHFECITYQSPIDKCKTLGCTFSPIAIQRSLELFKEQSKLRVGQQKQKKKK